ncbi:MAG: hypothetical protein LBT05_05170 [Planctomycetaceae bacterium]|nr:hypothetical protein [Planctomycetaceae bacterium]
MPTHDLARWFSPWQAILFSSHLLFSSSMFDLLLTFSLLFEFSYRHRRCCYASKNSQNTASSTPAEAILF